MTEGVAVGHVVIYTPDGQMFRRVPLVDRLFVGRECAGVSEEHRIILDGDLAISRNHLELRVDGEPAAAVLVDVSSNGTRVNGLRIERSVPLPLKSGDLIAIGDYQLEYVAESVVTRAGGSAPKATVSVDAPTTMAMVMGDLIGFSTVSEQADQAVLARDLDRLYQELRQVLAENRGTLVDYVGDAFFASWEIEADPDAIDHALAFAVAADERVRRCAPALELRNADGSPLRMGWGVSLGTVVMRLMPGSVVMVIGDAVNVGFRVSSIAGREHRPHILAIEAVRHGAKGGFSFSGPETLPVKGRVDEVTIYGVSGQT